MRVFRPFRNVVVPSHRVNKELLPLKFASWAPRSAKSANVANTMVIALAAPLAGMVLVHKL